MQDKKEDKSLSDDLSERLNYCLHSGQNGKIFTLLRGNGFLSLCSISFKTDITFLVPLMFLFVNFVSFFFPLCKFAECFSLGVATVHFPADVFRV